VSYVLDASIAMCWLLKDGTQRGIKYAFEVLEANKTAKAIVPSIWGLEVANVIAKVEAKNLITEAQTQDFLVTLQRMDIVVDQSTAHYAFSETLGLARRYKLSGYDAAYLELALREGLPLATLDDALEKAAKKAGVSRFAAK
jgi:predicted nucleic acid-binding protein